MGTLNPCQRFTKQLFSAFVILLLVLNEVRSDQCKVGCPSANTGKFRYQPGSTYEYHFDSVVTVSVTGSEPDDTSLKVNGNAVVYVEDNCGYVLKLDKVSVTSTKDNTKKPLQQDIAKPIRFTLSNGELEPQICTDPNESEYSLNIKRAIISLLQSSEKKYETDVFGVCPTVTSTSVSSDGGELITKTRNLNTCGYRETLANGLVSGVVNEKAGIKGSQLLSGEFTKEQKIRGGVIEHVDQVEEYTFLPVSNVNSGVRAKVKTVLKLTKTGTGAAPNANWKPDTIIFKHPQPLPTKNIDALRKQLDATIERVDEYAKSGGAQVFNELIRLMRQSDADTLTDLSGVPHQKKNLARKVYLDALFRTGTSESVKAIVRQVSKFNEQEKRLAFLSFNLVEYVSRDALNQAATLLNPNSPKEAYLAVGNLVNKYCREESCNKNEVNAISQKFISSLNKCKANNKADEDKVVYVLKGIRNTHRIADNAANTLIECASGDRSGRVRVAALQAFSAASCNPNLQNKALSILKDRNEDSEIRIEAYLAAVSCPNGDVANQIAEIVNSETVYQVGGFITTHLRSIRDSTDPTREAARHHLSNIRVTKKFPIDPRRYSYNSEVSYALESFGLGASADFNLIYSQNGFLPRSGKLNLTTEIFGKHFNVLEFNARQENLESILEYYFGPKGYLSAENIGNLLKNKRARRDVTAESAKLAKKYKSYGNKAVNDLNLDLSLKLFGSEFFFLSLGDNIPTTADELIRKLADVYNEAKNSVKSFNHDYECHSLFMDNELVYPTGIGFPLELVAQGTATTKIQVGLEIDLDSQFLNSKNRIKFVPSVDVNFNGQLRVDGSVLSTGLRVSTDLHSATGADVRLELLNNATGFNLDIQLPRQELELIEIKHNVDFIVTERDKETKVLPLKKKKKSHPSPPGGSCFDQLQVIGLTLCYTAEIPDVSPTSGSFPLVGPAHLALSLQSERVISLKGQHQKQNDYELWQLTYDTPGSKEPHTTVVKFEVGVTPKIFARASLDYPQKHLAGEVGIQNDDQEIAFYGRYEMGSDETLAKIGLKKSGNEFHPLIYVKSHDKVQDHLGGYKADGKVVKSEVGSKTRFEYVNFQVISPQGHRTTMNGYIDMDKNSFDSDLTIKEADQSYKVKAHGKFQPPDFAFGGSLMNENNPASTIGADVRVTYAEQHVGTMLSLQSGEYKGKLNLDYEWAEEQIKFENSVELNAPKGYVGSLKVNGQVKPNYYEVDVEANRGAKKLAVYTKFIQNEKAQGDYNLQFTGKLNKERVDLNAKGEIRNNKLHVDNNLQSSWGTQAQVKGEVGPRYSLQDIDINLEGTAILTKKDVPIGFLLKINGATEKTTGDFKLTRDKTDLVVFNGELIRPSDNKPYSGKVKLNVKDYLDVTSNFKIPKSGRGDLKTTIVLKKQPNPKKIVIESKFNFVAPKYDIDTTVTYDNDKKLTYKTQNNLDKQNFYTKNALEAGGDKYQLDVTGSVKGEWKWNGDINGNALFTLPSGRKLQGVFNRHANTQNGVVTGHGKIDLQDVQPNNQQRSLTWEVKVDHYNAKDKYIDQKHTFRYSGIDNRDIEVHHTVRHLPKGQYKEAELSTSVKGALVPTPFDLHINIDEYCKEHAVFRVSGKYGNKIDGNVNGNYNLGEHGKPASYEVQANVNLPETETKHITLQSSGKLVIDKADKGAHSGEIKYQHTVGDQRLAFDANAKGNENHGVYHLGLELPKYSPVKVDGSYLQESTDKGGKYQYSVTYDYGQNRVIKSSVDLDVVDENAVNFHYQLQSPFESARNVDLTFKGTKSNEDTYTTNSQLNYNGEQYGLNTVFVVSDRKNGADITAICPKRTSKISGYFERLGDRKGKAELKLENLGDFNFVGTSEAGFQSYEDFYVKIDLDSEKLDLKQIHIEANTQKGADGKGVVIHVTKAGENIISGTAQYTVKQDKGKGTIEGQGQILYMKQTTNANFKLVRQSYDLASDNEAGFGYTFTGTFGPKNIASTLKVTTKNFNVKLASCEEKKQCTNFEIRSVVTVDPQNFNHVQHELMVLIDLRELGYPHEFELQSKCTRQGLKIEHEFEASIISSNNNKYQLTANLKPTNNRVQFKLPQREILLESVHKLPTSIFGHYEESVTLYLDKKNRPNEKTSISFAGDVNGVENVALNANGAVKFEHPKIRTLSVSGQLDVKKDQQLINGNLVFDVFKTPQHQVVANWRYQGIDTSGKGVNVTSEGSIRSSALGIDLSYSGHSALSFERQEFSAAGSLQSASNDVKVASYMYGNREKFELLLNALGEEILSVHGGVDPNKKKLNMNSKVQVLGARPLVLNGELELNGGKFELKEDGLFDVKGDFKAGKEAKVTVTGSGKKLYNGRVSLAPSDFLSTTYESNKDDVQAFVKSLENQINQDTQKARENIDNRFQKARETFTRQAEALQASVPDLSGLRASYEEHINQIIKELEQDPALKELVGAYRRTYEALIKFISDVVKTVSESYKNIHATLNELYVRLSTIVRDRLLPELQAWSKKVTTTLGDLYVEVIKVSGGVFERLLEILKGFEGDFNKLGKPLSELSKSIGEFLSEITRVITTEWAEFSKEIEDYWHKLPTLNEIINDVKERLSKVTIINEIIGFVNDFIDQFEGQITTPEGKEFLRKLNTYVQAKLRNEKVDDVKELESIVSSFISALRSLITLVQGQDFTPSSFILTSLPISWDAFQSIPVWSSLKFSVFNFIRNEKWNTLADLLTFRTPLNLLPPYELRGHVSDGQHIFTFDGRHIAVPGSCKFVLAQDSVNNNFSVIANLKDGKMKSLILIDQNNMVEVSDQATLKLNKKPAEYPVHNNGVHVWRRYYTLTLLTEYGVTVKCSIDLRVCHVNVNGFYTGKTRGLLGNGNAEPYDDFTQPDGVIADNYATFANSYTLEGQNCPPIQAEEHNHEHAQLCKDYFGLDSSLLLGYIFIDPTIYKRACDHAVEKAANKEDAACNIALTYASAARMDSLPVSVPSDCLKCNANTPEQRTIGEEFETKVPQNKADVVFVVDTSMGLDQLNSFVTPTINDLKNQLKNRGFTDVNIATIGYDNSQKYPSLFTTNGKLNFNGRFDQVTLKGPMYEDIPYDFADPRVNQFIEQVRENSSHSLVSTDTQAFNLAMDYPFRADASKAIIAIRNDHLEYTNLLKIFAAGFSNEIASLKGISLHLVGPVKDLHVDGVPDEKIIGFNSKLVATYDGKDAKKRDKLQFKGDMGVDLVAEEGGWVFALQNSKTDPKKFSNVVSSSIADYLSKLEVTSECECKLVYGLHAEDSCTAEDKKFVPAKKPAKGA